MKKFFTIILGMLIAFPLLAGEYVTENDIAYKNDVPDAYVQKMCRLDVAYEEGGTDRPVIVWFHGGGLTGGHRFIPETLKSEGAVVIGAGYRFATVVELQDIIDDAAAAVAWVVKNAARYGGSVKKIYLAGHSAGGYLVNMLGLDRHYLARYGVDADSMAAIVPYSGQVITHFAQREKLGVSPLTPTIDSLAPLFHVRGDAAPMLIISGDREMELYGRYEETAYFARMLKLNGHKDVTFYELDGFNHGDMAEPAHLVLLKYIREREDRRADGD